MMALLSLFIFLDILLSNFEATEAIERVVLRVLYFIGFIRSLGASITGGGGGGRHSLGIDLFHIFTLAGFWFWGLICHFLVTHFAALSGRSLLADKNLSGEWPLDPSLLKTHLLFELLLPFSSFSGVYLLSLSFLPLLVVSFLIGDGLLLLLNIGLLLIRNLSGSSPNLCF